jgi:hypothetical protein
VSARSGPPAVLHAPRASGERTAALLHVDGDQIDLYFETPGREVSRSADGFVIAALLRAMAMGGPLIVEAPVSGRLLDALPKVQSIFNRWRPTLREIEVRAERADLVVQPAQRAAGVASFLSLGIDSFYTLLCNADEITHLTLVRGFDLAWLGEAKWDEISSKARIAAQELGKELIEVDTNVRSLGKGRKVDWDFLHGPALASVAHALTPSIGKVYVSASDTYATLLPWGTHPRVDHLWSSEHLVVSHFGAAVTRIEKIVEVANDPTALASLRVCIEGGRDNPFNCGRCSKCLVCMVTLESLGKLKQCPTFPNEIDLRAIRALDLSLMQRDSILATCLETLKDKGSDRILIRTIERKLRRYRTEQKLRVLVPERARALMRRVRSS